MATEVDTLGQYLATNIKRNGINLSAIKPLWSEKELNNGLIKRRLSGIELDGHTMNVSNRFIDSINSLFNISNSTYFYFEPAEVFERIVQSHPRTSITVTTDNHENIALGVISSNKELPACEDIIDVLDKENLLDLTYHNGVIKGNYATFSQPWKIEGDEFKSQFVLDMPVDGYTTPSIYLSMLRIICANLAIARGRAFQTRIQTGKKDNSYLTAVSRVLESYNNEEGYKAIADRIKAANNCLASVNETITFNNVLAKSFKPEILDNEILPITGKIIGSVINKYGVASANSISPKKRRLLNMDCKICDLINMATELSTHYTGKMEKKGLFEAWFGDLISNEYDLEENSETTPINSNRQSFYFHD